GIHRLGVFEKVNLKDLMKEQNINMIHNKRKR
ncbi:unnamed protein product, partial [marine sediment metagenome]